MSSEKVGEHISPHLRTSTSVQLPPDLWQMIFDYTNDDDLLVAFNLSQTTKYTVLDKIILWGSLDRVKLYYFNGFEKFGGDIWSACAKYGYIHALDFVRSHFPNRIKSNDIEKMLIEASSHGKDKILFWIFRYKYRMFFEWRFDTKEPLNVASANGHVHILNLWLKFHNYLYNDLKFKDHSDCKQQKNLQQKWYKSQSGLALKYGVSAINMASTNGHVKVLDWWRQSGLKLEYDDRALIGAARNSKLEILDWWVKSGLSLKYSESALLWASMHGNTEILDWWKSSGLELKQSKETLSMLSDRGLVHALQWWSQSGIELIYTEDCVARASRNGHINILQWWKDSGLEFKYKEDALRLASVFGRTAVLEWWKQSGLDLLYDKGCMNGASRYGHVETLKWWRNSKLEPKYDASAIYFASVNGHINVLNWWRDSGLDLLYDDSGYTYAKEANSKKVVDWWDVNIFSAVDSKKLNCTDGESEN